MAYVRTTIKDTKKLPDKVFSKYIASFYRKVRSPPYCCCAVTSRFAPVVYFFFLEDVLKMIISTLLSVIPSKYGVLWYDKVIMRCGFYTKNDKLGSRGEAHMIITLWWNVNKFQTHLKRKLNFHCIALSKTRI